MPQYIAPTIKDSDIIKKFMELKKILLEEERLKKATKKNLNKISNNQAFRLVVDKLHSQYQEEAIESQEESKEIIKRLKQVTLNQKLKLGRITSQRNNVYELRDFRSKVK
ncbi:MAG: hypothetical protein ACFFDB_00215 [Promethearchaeota archaeon]